MITIKSCVHESWVCTFTANNWITHADLWICDFCGLILSFSGFIWTVFSSITVKGGYLIWVQLQDFMVLIHVSLKIIQDTCNWYDFNSDSSLYYNFLPHSTLNQPHISQLKVSWVRFQPGPLALKWSYFYTNLNFSPSSEPMNEE